MIDVLLLFLSGYVERPVIMLWIVPALLVLAFAVAKRMGRYRPAPRMKVFVFISRLIIVSLLLIALASPYALYEKIRGSEPQVVFLIDNSTSFDLFDRQQGYYLYEQLSKQVDVTLKPFGDQQRSPLGDAMMGSLKKGRSLIVFSDGQITEGSGFGDVAVQATKLNASINVIHMEPRENDYSLLVDGPSRVSRGVETEYTLRVTGTPLREHDVVVSIDGRQEFTKRINDEFVFARVFDSGYHTITAELVLENDHFQENNVFYKTVKVIKEPVVSFLSDGESKLPTLLDKAYDLRAVSSAVPAEGSYALLVNDMPIDSLEASAKAVQKFVSDGNGLVVFGGLRSFDRGGYKESEFEKILPVAIAGAEKKEGPSSVVVVIDISQSFAIDPEKEHGGRYGEGDIGVSKALAINIMEGLKQEDYAGVIAFDTGSYVVSPLEMILTKDLNTVSSKIASLKPAIAGETMPTAGIIDALDMLASGPGAKNIILISDGHIQKQDQFFEAAQRAAGSGAVIYTLGVGEQTNEYTMRRAAEIGGGDYFQATQKNRIKILFGGGKQQQGKGYGVVLRDRNHFITEHLNIQAKVYGFNEAAPKASAQVLATTDGGDPLIVAWRYGLGRIVVVLTDDGDIFAPDLLSKRNSKLLLRAMAWAVGDPERKLPSSLTISDARLGADVEVIYRGDQPPQGSITFSPSEEGSYVGNINAEYVGFHELLGATYAINHPKEFEETGFHKDLLQLSSNTGGKVFSAGEVQEMIRTIKEQPHTTVLERWQVQWPFVLAALLVFLLEVCVRRIAYFKE